MSVQVSVSHLWKKFLFFFISFFSVNISLPWYRYTEFNVKDPPISVHYTN